MHTTEHPLATELDFFARHLDVWLADHSGEFVVIRGEQVQGFYGTLEAGVAAGLDAYGNVPFLVREVTRQQTPAALSTIVTKPDASSVGEGSVPEPGSGKTRLNEAPDPHAHLSDEELEERLPELVRPRRTEDWVEANQAALQDYNRFVAEHGVFSDGRRRF